MKYLKKFQYINEAYDEIAAICDRYGIKNWTLNDDLSIDVNSNIDLDSLELSKLPLRFRSVSGYFDCSMNKLTSLEGCPTQVGGDFICSHNKLTNLEGCPTEVGGSFTCYNNNLISLVGCPTKIVDEFDCSYNKLTSLEGCPLSVGGDFDCQDNKIRDFLGIVIIDGDLLCNDNPIWEIWDLFEDTSKIELLNDYDAIRGDMIILDRLNNFLEVIGKDPVTEVKGYNCI